MNKHQLNSKQLPAFVKQKKRPASLSKKIVTKQLKQKMGFNGLIVTDGLDMKGVASVPHKKARLTQRATQW